MSKTILYIATTLDGKIARKDGSLDWLYTLQTLIKLTTDMLTF